MEWLNSAITAVGLALIIYGLHLAWSPLAFLVGGSVVLRVAWSSDRSES